MHTGALWGIGMAAGVAVAIAWLLTRQNGWYRSCAMSRACDAGTDPLDEVGPSTSVPGSGLDNKST